MTQTEIQEIIQEFHGWERTEGYRSGGEWVEEGWIGPGFGGSPPDYCYDLNALAKVEQKLRSQQVTLYEENLKEELMYGGARVQDFNTYCSDFIWGMSAFKKAIALAKTIQEINKTKP